MSAFQTLDQLEPAGNGLAYNNRLNNALVGNRCRKLAQAFLIDTHTRLVTALPNAIEGQLAQRSVPLVDRFLNLGE